MKEKSFERELPEGYTEVFHLNAKNIKVGVVFNLIAGVIVLLIMALGTVPLVLDTDFWDSINLMAFSCSLYISILILLIYMVIHELIHGIAYKRLTGEKLKFGISWSCAFCGVPQIYTYRRTALIALLSPFVTFAVILLPLTVISYFISGYMYVVSLIVFASHFGGCIGDLYMTALLLHRFKDEKLLMRDTGPEQFIYLPDKKETENA